MNRSNSTRRNRGGPVIRFLSVPFRIQTYRNLAYLALSFPLGVLYFTAIVTGLAVGIGTIVTVFGVPLLLATIAAATILAGFEAVLVRRLVGIDTDLPEILDGRRSNDGSSGDGVAGGSSSDGSDDGPSVEEADDGAPVDEADECELERAEAAERTGVIAGTLAAIRRLLLAPTTWTSLVLVPIKFFFGIVAFVALVTAASLSVSLVTAPLLYDLPTVSYQFGTYTVDTLPEAVGLGLLGVLLTLSALHVLNALARLEGTVVAALLGIRSDSA